MNHPQTGERLARFEPPFDAMVQGASRGIGLAFCRLLLDYPGVRRVVATSRAASTCDELLELAQSSGGRLVTVDLDVTDESSIETAMGAVRGHVHRLRLLLNVAGLLHDGADVRPEKRLENLRPEAVTRLMQVNALGPALVLKHAHRLLPRRGHTVIANLSARVGSITDNRLGGWYGYRMSKAAQNMATRTAAIELRRTYRDLVCVALHPGTVATDLSAPFRERVAAHRVFDPATAALRLLTVITDLDENDNGRFFAWDGQEIPW